MNVTAEVMMISTMTVLGIRAIQRFQGAPPWVQLLGQRKTIIKERRQMPTAYGLTVEIAQYKVQI